jgi:hypothetical protein
MGFESRFEERSRLGWIAALLVALVLALAGCGGGPDTSTPDGAAEAFLQGVADGDAEEACSHATDEGTWLGPTISDVDDECEAHVEAVPDESRSEFDGPTITVEEETEEDADVFVQPADAPEGFGFDLNLEKSGDEWLVD